MIELYNVFVSKKSVMCFCCHLHSGEARGESRWCQLHYVALCDVLSPIQRHLLWIGWSTNQQNLALSEEDFDEFHWGQLATMGIFTMPQWLYTVYKLPCFTTYIVHGVVSSRVTVLLHARFPDFNKPIFLLALRMMHVKKKTFWKRQLLCTVI
jgi:hypothetical protein